MIIGRCADYALSDYPNVVSVFIRGDQADKIRHLAAKYNISEDKAKDVMNRTDKSRSSYYNYYSNKRWGSSKSYDLCINSSALGYDGAVDVILKFAEVKQAFNKKNREKAGLKDED